MPLIQINKLRKNIVSWGGLYISKYFKISKQKILTIIVNKFKTLEPKSKFLRIFESCREIGVLIKTILCHLRSKMVVVYVYVFSRVEQYLLPSSNSLYLGYTYM